MKKTFKKSILLVIAFTLTSLCTFAQSTKEQNFDYAYIHFENMGSIPMTEPEISAQWLHTANYYNPTNYYTYYTWNALSPNDFYRGTYQPNSWIICRVTVVFRVPGSSDGAYKASKEWDFTITDHVTFTRSDFTFIGSSTYEPRPDQY